MKYTPSEDALQSSRYQREYQNTYYITSGLNMAPYFKLIDGGFVSFPIGVQGMYIGEQKSRSLGSDTSSFYVTEEARFLVGPQIGFSMPALLGLPFSVKYSYLFSSNERYEALSMWNVQWVFMI